MRLASVTKRLNGLGGTKWEMQIEGRRLANAGADVIELTLGEPDVDFPQDLADSLISAIDRRRTRYAEAQGEHALLAALSDYYSARIGRTVLPENFLCFPGTQTALFAAMMALVDPGDEVLIGDPMYATYEGVVRSHGATIRPVPLRPETGFRMQKDDLMNSITDKSRVLLLTTPHNPTGAVLTEEDINEIAEVAIAHDLWVVSDEVYAELVFDGARFCSVASCKALADRSVILSSISKSHAATGLRSGWCLGPKAFIDAILPLSEAMLFGNQPFIADMTADALNNGSTVIQGMRERYAARAQILDDILGHERSPLKVIRPKSGMFALIDVSATGMTGQEFAKALLSEAGVAVMPGSSFGESIENFIRITLTAHDDQFLEAVNRIGQFSASRVAAFSGQAAE